ncbi:hypothetical protein ABIB26_001064 [Arthrobacter sp. UYEF20]
MTAERTATLNALIALVRVVDLGIDARRALTSKQIAEVSRRRTRDEQIGLATARTEAARLAKRVAELDGDIAANSATMTDLVRQSRAAVLLEKTGIGPVTATIALTAWSHPGRVRSEAAFAALAGTNPHPCLLREHRPPSTQPRRRPAPEPRPAHRNDHSPDPRPRHPRLRRQTSH